MVTAASAQAAEAGEAAATSAPDPVQQGKGQDAPVAAGAPAATLDIELDRAGAGVAAFLAREKDSQRHAAPGNARPNDEDLTADADKRRSLARATAAVVVAALGALTALACVPTAVSCVSEGASALGGVASRASQGMDVRALAFGVVVDATGHLPRLLAALAGVLGGAWPVKQAVCSLLLCEAPGTAGFRRALRRVGLLLGLACALYLAHVAATSACSSAGVAASVDQVVAAARSQTAPVEVDAAMRVG